MAPLWRWVSLRHLLGEGGRTLLVLTGIALGVGVYVSIRLANHSALTSFAQTVDAVAGKANLQITGDTGGFDERLFPRLKALPGVQAAAPVVQVYAPSPTLNGETLLFLGLDVFHEAPFARYGEAHDPVDREAARAFFADPRAVAIPRRLADRGHLRVGSPLSLITSGRRKRLTVRLILDSPGLEQALGGNVVLLDIATAQEVFDRVGRLDRIDLLVAPRERARVAAALGRLLPAHVHVGDSQSRTRQVENMVRAFEISLVALTFIAVFVAMFMVFNAVSLAVLRRRGEIGILRSLGTTRRAVLRLFLAEALVLGLIGSALGLAAGTLLARLTLGAVARTLTDLYLIHIARQLHYDPAIYAQGMVLGVLTSLAAALAPATEASRTPPGQVMRQGVFLEARAPRLRRWTTTGLGMLALAGVVAWGTQVIREPAGGFFSAFLVLVGFSLLAPPVTAAAQGWLAPAARRLFGIEGLLGARYLHDALARTAVIVASVMVAVGMMIGLAVMVRSFRNTVDTWVTQTIKGDLYIEPVGRRITGSATRLPEEVIAAARSLPGVAAVDTYRALRITYGGRVAYVAALEFNVLARYGRLRFMRGDSSALLSRLYRDREEGVVVTESFAFWHRVRPGDRITLATPDGARSFPVLGVFYDYSTDAGAVLMDRALYARLWHDSRTESLAIYLPPGADVEATRRALLRRLGGRYALNVMANQDLRQRVMRVFDQTFQITYALQAITVLVAVLGVIASLTALILQRGREIGVLRAVGALRRQVRRIVLVEAGLIGLVGSVLGCVCGIILSTLLVFIINKQFFGWSIQMRVEPGVLAQAVLLVTAAAVAAGLVPARLAASRLPAEAMRVE
ncbi:MAG: FtsX-like permease family protein [Armatimonadetes bacterium]|nr:FtsX-like permease family protein [Armatimonadota bacterium]